MNSKQKRISIAAMGLVVLLWLIFPFAFSVREPSPPLTKSTLLFDAARAMEAARELVSQYPRRVFGSIESRQSTGYLQQYLENLGYETTYSHFDARIAGKKQVGRNILAHKKGQNDEILCIISHFDTARTAGQGAVKNGAAVGVLLEIARIFASGPTRRSLLIVLSDGGEWGMLGAQDVVNSYPSKDRIAAVLSLDYVAPGDLAGFSLEEAGLGRGFSPPWLRTLARRAAEAQDLPVSEPSGLAEHFERAFRIPRSDQGPFLRAGIPAINLGSKSTDPELQDSVYHSSLDTLEQLKIASIKTYGLVVERILRSLDELEVIPSQPMEYFRISDSLFLRPKASAVLHVVSFLPLALIFYFHLRNHGRNLTAGRIAREAWACFATVLPILAVYFSIGLFRALRLIPVYPLYPATAKDPLLESPPWGVLGGIFTIGLLVALVCYAVAKYSFREMPVPDFHVSKTVLLALLMILSALALIRNSYWASAFLSLPAWIWALTGPSKRWVGRVKNWTWILAAGIPYYLALGMIASRESLGWNLIWHQVLSLSTGLYTGAGYILAAGTVVIGIRFLVIQSRSTPPADV